MYKFNRKLQYLNKKKLKQILKNTTIIINKNTHPPDYKLFYFSSHPHNSVFNKLKILHKKYYQDISQNPKTAPHYQILIYF